MTRDPLFTVTFNIDWWDAYMAVVSLTLLYSYVMAVKASSAGPPRSYRLMFVSGAVIALGHAAFLVVGTALSLEGFYIANVAFITAGTITMRLKYRQLHAAGHTLIRPTGWEWARRRVGANEPRAVGATVAATNGTPVGVGGPDA